MPNYIEDFAMGLVPYEDHAPNCEDCKVSFGFIHPFKTVRDEMVEEVARLSKDLPNYAVKTTGHSLGANWAQLAGMYLLAQGHRCDQVINFGQMRQGNKEYADYSNKIMPNQFRVVHHRDMIPHQPFLWMGYHHQYVEMYEDENGDIRQCDNSGEDPTCADQWDVHQYSAADHHVYLQMDIDHCVYDQDFEFLQ